MIIVYLVYICGFYGCLFFRIRSEHGNTVDSGTFPPLFGVYARQTAANPRSQGIASFSSVVSFTLMKPLDAHCI